MLNPSTADAEQDDATIRKVVGFSRRWGYAQARVVNLYALRATDCRELKRHVSPFGELNKDYLEAALLECDRVVVGWGRGSKLPDREMADYMSRLAQRQQMWCLGVCADGQPVHPLMISYDRELIRWK